MLAHSGRNTGIGTVQLVQNIENPNQILIKIIFLIIFLKARSDLWKGQLYNVAFIPAGQQLIERKASYIQIAREHF